LADVAGRLYSQKPFVGVGLNNFIPRAAGVKTLSYYSWYLQPVHNVPLLVLVETGLVGFTLFVWFLFKLIKRSAATSVFFALSIVFILVTAFLDHYWLTLQQNQLLLAVFIGVIYRANKKRFLLN
jgi:O-antigen ligase